MRAMQALVVFALVFALVPISSIIAKVQTGTGTVWLPDDLADWDFSAESPVSYPGGDMAIIHELHLGLIVATLNGAAVRIVTGKFDEVLEAPADLTSYDDYVSISGFDLSQVYVVHTEEGHFAKFRFVDGSFITIEYAYQDDGSRVLDPGVPVRRATWGTVKSRFK